ncbi:hypothetical protein GQX73_g10820 [Xylaria multiplex]|uniref:Granulins domain-containing protein n=1 Tax=Xylaria multiplex TaxID=323545 RepID=A0A7C8MK99_9PEZI|nr:hypothetical protein GQX73_g10820 [Xylaria multiplex]
MGACLMETLAAMMAQASRALRVTIVYLIHVVQRAKRQVDPTPSTLSSQQSSSVSGLLCNEFYDDNACNTNEALCGDYCIPITGTCCNSQGYYCPDFGICTSNDLCCDPGGDCENSGSSLDATSTFESPSTSSLLSSGNSNDSTTFILSKSTLAENGDSLPTPASTTKGGDNGLAFPTGVTGDNGSSPQPTQPHITVTITPSSPAARPGQVGGHGVTDCRIIAGLVGIAALLT